MQTLQFYFQGRFLLFTYTRAANMTSVLKLLSSFQMEHMQGSRVENKTDVKSFEQVLSCS